MNKLIALLLFYAPLLTAMEIPTMVTSKNDRSKRLSLLQSKIHKTTEDLAKNSLITGVAIVPEVNFSEENNDIEDAEDSNDTDKK